MRAERAHTSDGTAKISGGEFCDDNNNNGTGCLSQASRNQETRRISATSRRQSDEQDNSSNQDEDWQLIEPEKEEGFSAAMVEQSAAHKQESPRRQVIANNQSDAAANKRRSSAYLELDPLDSQSGQYSPILVHLCTAIYSLLPLASVIATFTLTYLLFTRFYPITLLYFSCIFLDRNTCNRGGRRIDRVYNAKFWQYLAAYFPIKLRRTQNFKLDPSENYILNYHPHGISAFGSVSLFATNALKFTSLFPGIAARFMVHETSFMVPIMRETFMLRGDCSVNSRSIDYMLSKSAGNLLTIVGGGLAEADLSDAEVLKIVVAKRKGFVKKALKHGAHIIPCIAFGENSVFCRVDLSENSVLHKLASKWYSLFKFKHPIYFGQSAFSSQAKGLMPFKRPITLVLGDPIRIGRPIEEPTQEDIDGVHERYLNQLKSMYSDNQDLCSKYDKQLELI